MKVISVNLTIGKSKTLVTYWFRSDDFIRIEGNELILKTEHRTLRMTDEEIKSVVEQLNGGAE